jgi:hypothetical protein
MTKNTSNKTIHLHHDCHSLSDGHLWVTGGYDGPSGENISKATWIIAPIRLQP